jgi:hypothetical protein
MDAQTPLLATRGPLDQQIGEGLLSPSAGTEQYDSIRVVVQGCTYILREHHACGWPLARIGSS